MKFVKKGMLVVLLWPRLIIAVQRLKEWIELGRMAGVERSGSMEWKGEIDGRLFRSSGSNPFKTGSQNLLANHARYYESTSLRSTRPRLSAR
jgi:hypothetical protein